jgi:hypothetical protein
MTRRDYKEVSTSEKNKILINQNPILHVIWIYGINLYYMFSNVQELLGQNI